MAPKKLNIFASLVISSNVRISPLGKNAYCGPNISAGIQYLQRKLQRSVTEILKSRIGLPRVSLTLPILHFRSSDFMKQLIFHIYL